MRTTQSESLTSDWHYTHQLILIAAILLMGAAVYLFTSLTAVLFIVLVVQFCIILWLVSSRKKALTAVLALLHTDGEGQINTAPFASDQQFKNNLLLLLKTLSRRVILRDDSVSEISHSAEELSSHSEHLATNIVQQSQATTSLAAGLSEIEYTLGEVSRNITDIRQSVQSTHSLSQSGANSVTEVRSHVEQVAELSKGAFMQLQRLEALTLDVSSITELISEVSEQTNLLALNAAIEAARAGEHGRGFSVVADEVRNLADKTSGSARQISDHIAQVKKQSKELTQGMKEVVHNIESTVSEATNIELLLTDISDKSSRINEDIRDIAGASRQQQQATAEMSKSIEELAITAQENGQAAEQTALIARHVWSLSNDKLITV